MTHQRNSVLRLLGLIFAVFFILATVNVIGKEDPTPTPIPNIDVAKYEGKILKMQELIDAMALMSGYRANAMSEDRIRNMEPKELEEFAGDYLFRNKMAEIAEKEGFSEDEKIKDQLKSIKDRIMANQIYKNEVIDKIPSTSEKECKQFYEENKKDKFRRPFSFKMSHIFLSTYVPHVAKEGDTLEGIAEKISKDKKIVEFILKDDETKDPRYIKPEEREEKPFRPVQPGEKLLIPMSEADKKKVYEKILSIHKDLKNGADFTLLAKKHSETGPNKGEVIGPIIPESDRKPMLPEIIDAVKKTDKGKFSEIVQTKHGYNIIKVEEKNEEDFVPFEQVQRSIESKLTSERRSAESKKFLLKIAENTKGITVNKNVFNATERTSDSVIVGIGDIVKFTLSDYYEYVPEQMREKAESPDDKIILILESRKVILPLLSYYGEIKNVDETEEFQKEYKQRKGMIISDLYLRKLKSEEPELTDEKVEEFYRENLDRYKEPKKFDLSILSRKIKEYGEKMTQEDEEKIIEELKKELSAVRKKIKTKEDFEKFAEEISEDPTNKTNGYVGFVPETYRNGFNGELEKLKTGDISEPFVYVNFVYLLMVHDIIPEKVRPFEECRNSVKRDLEVKRSRGFELDKKAEILKAGGFELLIKE